MKLQNIYNFSSNEGIDSEIIINNEEKNKFIGKISLSYKDLIISKLDQKFNGYTINKIKTDSSNRLLKNKDMPNIPSIPKVEFKDSKTNLENKFQNFKKSELLIKHEVQQNSLSEMVYNNFSEKLSNSSILGRTNNFNDIDDIKNNFNNTFFNDISNDSKKLSENKHILNVNIFPQIKTFSTNRNTIRKNNYPKKENSIDNKHPIQSNENKPKINSDNKKVAIKQTNHINSEKESIISRSPLNPNILSEPNPSNIIWNTNKRVKNNFNYNKNKKEDNFFVEKKLEEKRESKMQLKENTFNNQGKKEEKFGNLKINKDNNNDLLINKPITNDKKKRDNQIDNLLTESKTRIILTESITKKVIILILMLVVFLPILSEEIYTSNEIEAYSILSKFITNYITLMPKDKFQKHVYEYLISEVNEKYPIINITDVKGNVIYKNETLQKYEFRSSEIESIVSNENDIIILYSIVEEIRLSALLSIIKTLFVCMCLLIAIVYFEKDTKKLVLDPLEIMIEIVDIFSKDPIKAKDLEYFDLGAKSIFYMCNSDVKKLEKYKKEKEKSEVKIIQSAIKKIAALLAIGLGEAGSEIIKENLSNYNDLDPMINGRKKKAIFGFCNIRDFPIVNDALQEHTVVFLNQVADIVHSSVDLFFGATNKNIGDAFLSVWKIPNINGVRKISSNKKLNSNTLENKNHFNNKIFINSLNKYFKKNDKQGKPVLIKKANSSRKDIRKISIENNKLKCLINYKENTNYDVFKEMNLISLDRRFTYQNKEGKIIKKISYYNDIDKKYHEENKNNLEKDFRKYSGRIKIKIQNKFFSIVWIKKILFNSKFSNFFYFIIKLFFF